MALENCTGTLFLVFVLRIMLKNHTKKGHYGIHDYKNFYITISPKYIYIFQYGFKNLPGILLKRF